MTRDGTEAAAARLSETDAVRWCCLCWTLGSLVLEARESPALPIPKPLLRLLRLLRLLPVPTLRSLRSSLKSLRSLKSLKSLRSTLPLLLLLVLPLPVTVVKDKVRGILEEYFVSGSLEGAIKDLRELEGQRAGQEAVKRLLVIAMEKKSRDKERASVLLSAMTRVYGSEQFFEGFIRVLKSIDDLALDNPDVVAMLSNFIARAIVDDVLPPSFVSLVPERLAASSPRVRQVLSTVQQLVEKGGARSMVQSWGAASKSTVDELKAAVKALVDEYFVERELQEAVRCVRELDAAHFGHEVVKRIVYQAVERGDKDLASATALLKGLLDHPPALESSQLTKVLPHALLVRAHKRARCQRGKARARDCVR